MAVIEQWRLRAEFARRLSDMYGTEVPAYRTLVEVSQQVNEDVLRAGGADAQRLGAVARVTAERHGAVRVGTPDELRQVAGIFGALGMYPAGFYDLREAATSAVPVVSTAFRPVLAEELARNPFRMFTSMLTTADPRFFDEDLRGSLAAFLARRELFPPELLELAARAEREGGLPSEHAERFLELAVRALELSPEPVDKAWYERLARISAVAADIGGVRSTHVNHLTPRVLDIDDLYDRMTGRGIIMIDAIQGPPRWFGPAVLLRQTSFRALAEPRALRLPGGRVASGALRVRFGEVEARGIALTPAGRARYDTLLARTDRLLAEGHGADRDEVARALWEREFPPTERDLAAGDLGYFTYRVLDRAKDGRPPPVETAALVDQGWVRTDPIVYEDFLPRSAAGIFQSNLTGEGARDETHAAADYDAGWLAGVLDREVHDPFDLYARQRARSLDLVARTLGLPRPPDPSSDRTAATADPRSEHHD